MKHAVAASSLIAFAAAVPQFGPGGGDHNGGGRGGWDGNWDNGKGPFGGSASCVSSCWQDFRDSGCSANDYSCVCRSDSISNVNSCIADSDCDQSDKDATYQVIAQACANAGETLTHSPEASFSATSGGSAWPTAWTTNSAWASAVSAWETQTTGAPAPFAGWAGDDDHNGTYGPGGWRGGNGYGPFGRGGPGNGWGPWGDKSTGAWTEGPWTSWWGGSACPPSTWSGWTSGPWSDNAPWTTWSGCTAETTASSVVTTTVTTGESSGSVVTSTDFGVRVAAVTQDGSATSSADTAESTGAAAPANVPSGLLAVSVVGVIGILGGAIML